MLNAEYDTKLFLTLNSDLIFLRFADQRFAKVERELVATIHAGSRRTIGKAGYQACGFMHHSLQVRFSQLAK